MVECIKNETKFSVNEKKKVFIGERHTVEQFDIVEIQQQLVEREQVIKNNEGVIETAKKQIAEMEQEIKNILVNKEYIEQWQKEYTDEQKKAVAEYEERIKVKKGE